MYVSSISRMDTRVDAISHFITTLYRLDLMEPYISVAEFRGVAACYDAFNGIDEILSEI